MNKILITGAAGFIGSHLVEHLLDEGVKPQYLYLLIPKGESLKNLPKLPFNIIRGDIRNKSDIKKAVKDINIIYHLAALIIRPEYSDQDYLDVNVKGTKNLLESIKLKKIKKFVFFSSVAIYGLPAFVGDMKSLNEDSPINYKEIYGESKFRAEGVVLEAHRDWKVPYAIIRPTTVYEPRDDHGMVDLFITIKKHLFFIIGDGQNKLDYVYVKDLVRAARLAEKSELEVGDYIIGGGEVSLNNVGNYISKSLDSWILPIKLPKTLAYPLSNFTEFISQITKIKLPFYPKRVKAMTSNFYFNLSKSRKEIGYYPKFTFREGIDETVKFGT